MKNLIPAIKHAIAMELNKLTNKVVYTHESARTLAALLEGSNYAATNMQGARAYSNKQDVLLEGLAHAEAGGLFAEFGVYSGATINLIADRAPAGTVVDGFDSFEGLPEDWFGKYTKGFFNTKGSVPKVRPNVRLHVGWFNTTVPAYAKSEQGRKCSFLHIDCDLYSSTKAVFDALDDHIGPGTVIVFDEYFNYDGWKEHEFKAFHEFIARRGLRYRYLAYNVADWNAAVQITS
ncbi:class I SAM-dependent methyltransferase [Chthonobacter albigriseus]|uniref:class I SAM-dependent methyltransferase n=1 Tax=Chthonobacter albigriseus TaxID=1683161 RepID=UPI0015EF995C|nr:class I SAM-dependent methyltransferase [Chthonobacter albigriseus]